MFYFNGTRKPDFRNIQRIDYDSYWNHRGVNINKKLKEREMTMMGLIAPGSLVYDVGCGSSRLPLELAKKGCEVCVADISPVILQEFTKHAIKTEKIDLTSITSMAVKGRYDYIILSEVLEHLSNPEEVITAYSAHTDFFLLTVPNSAFYRYRLHLMFVGRFFTQWAFHPSEHLRYWSSSDFRDWIGAMGLRLIRATPVNGLTLLGIPLYRWWPNMFAHQIVYMCRTSASRS